MSVRADEQEQGADVEVSAEAGRAPGGAGSASFVFISSSVLLVLAGAGAAILLRQAPHAAVGAWALVAVLAMTILVGAFAGTLLHRARWVHPLRQVRRMLDEIQQGERPIDDLTLVPGPIGEELLGTLQELLHELRRQRAEVAKLEGEMRARIAHRTSALERTIGSLRQQATRDALTGLHNRRTLDEYLPAVFERCVKEGTGLVVMMLDVDNFKLLNDTLGHPTGDQFLADLGDLIRSTVASLPVGAAPGGAEDDGGPPRGPLAFRCGGDEFVLLLAGCENKAGPAVANRLVALVDALAKPLRLKRPPRLSIGMSSLAELPKGGVTAEGLLKRADQALYAVKATRHRRRTDAIPA